MIAVMLSTVVFFYDGTESVAVGIEESVEAAVFIQIELLTHWLVLHVDKGFVAPFRCIENPTQQHLFC